MRSLRHLACVGLAVAALSPDAAAGRAARRQTQVGIVLEHPPAEVLRRAPAIVAETDAVWSRRGVSVHLADARQTAPGELPIVVRFASPPSAGPRPPGRSSEVASGLGFIWFSEDGIPGDTITLDDRAVVARLGEAKLNGRSIADWPRTLVDQVTARALGRVLAHELGHYLLASPAHSATGLMRRAFSGADLAAFDRTRFILDRGAVPRLNARLARLDAARDAVVAANGGR